MVVVILFAMLFVFIAFLVVFCRFMDERERKQKIDFELKQYALKQRIKEMKE